MRLLNAQKMLPAQLQTKLSRVARSGFRKLRSKSTTDPLHMDTIDGGQQQQWLAALMHFDDERLRVEPETFYMWIRVRRNGFEEIDAKKICRTDYKKSIKL